MDKVRAKKIRMLRMRKNLMYPKIIRRTMKRKRMTWIMNTLNNKSKSMIKWKMKKKWRVV